MKISNLDISSFGARVQNKMFTDGVDIKSMEWLPNGVTPALSSEGKEFKLLKIKILFEGSSRDEVHKNISRFMAKVTECNIKFKNISNNFKCFYQSSSRQESGIDEWLFLNIEFICYEYANEVVANYNSITTIKLNNVGSDVTPAIVEVTPSVYVSDIKLEGLADDPIVIKNLYANKTVIIDGEKQKVTVDGINKYGDTDMWDFPRLIPGTNIIKISKNNCDIKIKYKPRFI